MLTASKIVCPNCTKALKLSQPPAVGKRLRCPQCGCPFTVSANDVGDVPAAPSTMMRAAPMTISAHTPPPLPSAPASAEDGAAPPSRGLLLAGILGGLVLLLGGAAGLALYFANRATPGAQQASNDSNKNDKPSGTADGGRKADDKTDQGPDRPSGPREETIRPTGYEAPRPKPPDDPTTPISHEPVVTRSSLSAEDQARVNKAIERGVDFLKIQQTAAGTWNGAGHPLAMAALPALTLLECGVPADDRFIQKAVAFVRSHAANNTSTYEISLALLFLDRLGDKQDEPLLRSLGLRLLTGQTPAGGWSYGCQAVDPRLEPNLLLVLEQTRPRNPLELFVTGTDGRANLELIGLDTKVKLSPELIGMASKLDPDGPFRGVAAGVNKLRPDFTGPDSTVPRNDPVVTERDKERTEAARKALANLPPNLQRIPSLLPPSVQKEMPRNDQSDNSNTQFAILGVLAASRHGVPTDRAMGLIVQRFRTSQNQDGTFGYHYLRGGGSAGSPSMTGAGLLGLAVTHGLTAGIKMEGMAAKGVQDQHIQKALTALSRNIDRPLGKPVGPRGRAPVNLYFLWTVERVGMLYGLPKINDKDWYHWGAEALLETQMKDGNWANGGYHQAMPNTDTCFALLFLKRANLAKDLTVKIQSKLELIVEDK